MRAHPACPHLTLTYRGLHPELEIRLLLPHSELLVARAALLRPDSRRSNQMRHQRRMRRRKTGRIMTAVAAIVAVAAVAVAGVLHDRSADPARALPIHLPGTPLSYLGVYANSAPLSYAGLTAFTNTTGVEPDVVMYYSGWFQSFPNGFAST